MKATDFSLRMVARRARRDGRRPARTGGAARPRWMAAAEPPGAIRRGTAAYPQAAAAQADMFARYNAYGALRGYDELELAVNRGEPLLGTRLWPCRDAEQFRRRRWAANITPIIPAIR